MQDRLPHRGVGHPAVEDPRVPKLDEQFHGTIARASGNRMLASFVAALHLTTEPVHYLDLSPEVGRTTVRQHQRIVAAIDDRDPVEAEAGMVEHLTYLREHLAEHARGRAPEGGTGSGSLNGRR